jgi:hypothetical protein
MKIGNLLKTLPDYWHFFLGLAAGVLFYHFKPLCGIITLVFMLYQIVDIEERESTVKDIVVYLAGWMISFTLL